MHDLPEYELERQFDASPELVWRAWTEPELLNRWYGPGAETIIHKFDLRPGGLWLGEMKWGERSNFSKVVFKEVSAPERLVWHHSPSDADWNIVANPMMPDWPLVLLTCVTFTDQDGGTLVRLTWVPVEATEAQIACFAGALGGMDKGWAAGFAVLDQILTGLKTEET